MRKRKKAKGKRKKYRRTLSFFLLTFSFGLELLLFNDLGAMVPADQAGQEGHGNDQSQTDQSRPNVGTADRAARQHAENNSQTLSSTGSGLPEQFEKAREEFQEITGRVKQKRARRRAQHGKRPEPQQRA